MIEIFVYIFVGVLALFNFAVSVFVARRDDLNGYQKLAQIAFVWVVPILGSMMAYSVNRSHDVTFDVAGGSDGGFRNDFNDSSLDAGGDGE